MTAYTKEDVPSLSENDKITFRTNEEDEYDAEVISVTDSGSSFTFELRIFDVGRHKMYATASSVTVSGMDSYVRSIDVKEEV